MESFMCVSHLSVVVSSADPPFIRRLHPDSEDSDSDVDLSFLSSSKISIPSTTEPTDTADYGIAGILDEEEDSQLNPYRVAYESGWQRANDEMANEVKAMERRP